MRTFILTVVMAVVILVIAGCPKGSNKILGGPNIPKDPGSYIDIGYGWNVGLDSGRHPTNMPIQSTAAFSTTLPLDKYTAAQMSGSTVRMGYRMSATERGASEMLAGVASSISLYVFDDYERRDDWIEAVDKIRPTKDLSNPDKGYLYYEWVVPGSSPIGMYGLNAFEQEMLIIQQ